MIEEKKIKKEAETGGCILRFKRETERSQM